jgi:hypothetical protein
LYLVGVNQGWNIVTHFGVFIRAGLTSGQLTAAEGPAVIVLCKLHFCCLFLFAPWMLNRRAKQEEAACIWFGKICMRG